MPLTATQKTLRGLIAVAALFCISIGTMIYMSSRLATLNASTEGNRIAIAIFRNTQPPELISQAQSLKYDAIEFCTLSRALEIRDLTVPFSELVRIAISS